MTGEIVAYASPDSTYAVTKALFDRARTSILIVIYDFAAGFMELARHDAEDEAQQTRMLRLVRPEQDLEGDVVEGRRVSARWYGIARAPVEECEDPRVPFEPRRDAEENPSLEALPQL